MRVTVASANFSLRHSRKAEPREIYVSGDCREEVVACRQYTQNKIKAGLDPQQGFPVTTAFRPGAGRGRLIPATDFGGGGLCAKSDLAQLHRSTSAGSISETLRKNNSLPHLVFCFFFSPWFFFVLLKSIFHLPGRAKPRPQRPGRSFRRRKFHFIRI